MISEQNRRVLRHLWETEDDRICTATWRTTLTPEEEELVNSWDEAYNEVNAMETFYADLDDEDLIAMELEQRDISI